MCFFGGRARFFGGSVGVYRVLLTWTWHCVLSSMEKKTPQIPILISQFSIIITTDPHGGLIDYEALQPRLEILLKSHQEDARLTASLEKRVDALMERHATHVRIRFCFCFSVL